MKNPKKEFFDELEKEIKYPEYANRLKQELEDHLEDATNDKVKNTKKTDASEKALHNLGAPADIAKEYNMFMRSQKKIMPFLEAMFVSILSLPLYILALKFPIDFLYSVVGSPDFLNTSDLLRNFAPGFIIKCMLLFIIFIVFYFFTLGDISRSIGRRYHSWLYFILVFVAPAALFISGISSFIGSDFRDWQGPIESQPFLSGFLFITIFALCVVCGFLVCMFFIRQDKAQNSKHSIALKHVLSRAKVVLSVAATTAFMLIIVFTTVLMFVQDPTGPDRPILAQQCYGYDAVCLTFDQGIPNMRLAFEYFFLHVLPFIFLHPFSALVSQIMLGWVIVAIGVYCVWGVIQFALRKRKGVIEHFPFLKLNLLFYALVLLVFSPAGDPKITWHAPVAEISHDLETYQLGIFYPMTKYLNQDEGPLFFYTAFPTAFGFEFYQRVAGEGDVTGTATSTRFSISDIQSVDDFHITKKRGAGTPSASITPLPLPEGFGCKDGFTYEEGLNGVMQLSGYVDLQEPHNQFCMGLTLNNQTLFDIDGGAMIKDVTLNDEKTFAMIQISNGLYDPDYLYLVDLRGF